MTIVYVVGGPAGTGKSTIGELLSKHFKCPFIEGDGLHPQSNIDKMSNGLPLTDEDRWDWLTQISVQSSQAAVNNDTGKSVVSCSMLKKIYREHIKSVADSSVEFRFIFLYTTFEELLSRVSNRQGHYMKSDMVKSQYDIMNIPEKDELVSNGGNSIAIDTTDKSPEEIFHELLASLDNDVL